MGRYLYESHMGGFYAYEEHLDSDFLYCETCGDSDDCLGFFRDEDELRSLFEGLEELYGEDYIEDVLHQIVSSGMEE